MSNMKNISFALLVAAVIVTGLTANAFTYGELDNRTAPGTVLEDGGYYYVRVPTTIDATELAGQSALRVASGASVVIEIEAGASLTVLGGHGVGQLPGGAGIEVPKGSKLAVCGAGFLFAQGGSAANGVAGEQGGDGQCQVLVDVQRDPAEDAWREWMGEKKEEKPEIDPKDLVPIFCGRCGTGGEGGNGGGGAGAGIGGRGGRGGVGGAGADCRTVVKGTDWKEHQKTYEWWFGLLNWTNNIYQYAYYDLSEDEMKLCASGLNGAAGTKGEPGEGCGEIVVGEYVQVLAFPGDVGTGGASGRHGDAYGMFDSDYDMPTTVEFLINGLKVMSRIFSKEGDESDGKEQKEQEESPDYTEKKLWFYGGGGGGGGAGGAAPADGIGPGGNGGGGGGGGGSGLFAIGPTCGENEVNGEGGKGGGGYVCDLASEEARKKGEQNEFSTSGTDANADNEGESAHVLKKDEEGEEHEDYNDIGGRLTTACLMSDKQRAYAGRGGAGGAAAVVKPQAKVRGSENAIILGIDEDRIVSFSGEMTYEAVFDDCDGLPPATNVLICSTLVTPLDAIPVGEGDKTGKFFNGYYTGRDGSGTCYYDASGFPNTNVEIWASVSLYAHWTDRIGENQRLVNLQSNGETLFSFVVTLGGPLPFLSSKRLGNVRGWTCVGAYRMVGEEPEYWYDEDGAPLIEIFPGKENVDLELVFEPKWDMMAEAPEDGATLPYSGEGQRVAHSGEEYDYEIVGGTVVATNVGIYSTLVRFRRDRNEDGSDGEPLFEIWDDTLSTNDVREIRWRIVKTVIEGVSLGNTSYDWTQTNNMFRFEGKIPWGVEVDYEVTRILDRATVEVKATLRGGVNYYDKELISTLTVPQAVYVTSVRPHYPWNTTVDVDFGFVPELFEGICRVHEYVFPVIVTEGAEVYGDEHYHVLSNGAVRIAGLVRGGGTLTFDLKDAVGEGFRGTVAGFLSIDGMPASFSVDLATDTTAVADEDGVPVYEVTAAHEVLPINYSWRYETDILKMNNFAEVELTFDSPGNGSLTFAPVNETGQTVNEGAVRWKPFADGEYGLSVSVTSETNSAPVVRRVRFQVDYAEGEPKLPTVAKVGETGYTSLSAAVAEVRESGTNEIVVVGDVQTENVSIPDGVSVTFGRGGVFDARRMLGDNYHKMEPVYNSLWELTGWRYALDPEQVTPVIADFTVSSDGGTVKVSNVKPGLRYMLEDSESPSDGWRTVESRTAANAADIVFTVDGSAGRFFRVIVTDP